MQFPQSSVNHSDVLGRFIPSDERALLIEDTSETHLAQDILVRFEAR